jgi:hypothetical protein
MGNPNPRKEFLVPVKRADKTKAPLSDKTIALRLFEDVDIAVRALPNKTAWLRRVITEAAQRELMNKESKTK